MAKDENVSAEQVVRDIRRETRRKYSAEEKIRIVLEGLGSASGGRPGWARQANAGRNRHPPQHLLPLVRAVAARRHGRFAGSIQPTTSVLEPHPSDSTGTSCADCAGPPRAVAA